ncbi:SERPINE1 mRNA-binding protein 1-like isoform X2 [Ornithodoros turicata]|uniref:SERPINE1 mRNA-binding protein 1-like isoform X2 n=1 Tax=Ornithodoros turicata TaxID=34597 RepID=UPI003139A134
MENSYGIGVKNRYELFYDDDEDPVELLRQQEEEKEKRKAEKITSKDKSKGTKSVKPPPSSTTKKIPKEIPVNKSQERAAPQRDENNRARTTRPDRAVKFASGPRDDQRDFEERKNRRNREERTGPGSENRFDSNRDRGEGDLRRGGRGGGLGRGGFRGGRGRGAPGPRGFDSRGKREFDRQSGSDKSVKPVDKKGGEGQYNWGTVHDDLEVQLSPFAGEEAATGDTSVLDKSGEEHSAENAADTSKEEGGETAEDEAAAAAAREMTLDEYKREQEQKRSRASFNIRKPGEGEENAQWKKMYVLKKKEGEEDDEEEDEEEVGNDLTSFEDDDEYARRGRQRQVVDIEINFADARRGRGGGRGRGMGRGSRPGGPQGDRGRPREPPVRGGDSHAPKQSAPKVDDWNDFPSLVTA